MFTLIRDFFLSGRAATARKPAEQQRGGGQGVGLSLPRGLRCVRGAPARPQDGAHGVCCLSSRLRGHPLPPAQDAAVSARHLLRHPPAPGGSFLAGGGGVSAADCQFQTRPAVPDLGRLFI